jgi:3-oxoadipate enol-lactonase
VVLERLTDDGRFAYEASGDATAPALVFLHGIGGAARGWRRQIETFAPACHTLAWDMPGYGKSPPLAEVSIATLAHALVDFLAALHLERPILVGHSIGGMIVQRLIAERPHAARAVVLAQTSPAFGRPDGDWQRKFIADRLGPLDRGETMPIMAPKLVADLVGDAPDPDGVVLAESCMAATDPESYRSMMLALVGFDLKDALALIDVPTMVLSGSKDGNAPAPMMRRMSEAIPGAHYVELQGCGHLANLERPAEFDAALHAFLDTLA